MAAMWLALFSTLLLQVSSYGNGFNPQQAEDISQSVYRAELPLNCPFHQEKISLGHLEDTVKGTINQEGNFAFDKLPGNLLANLDHVNKFNPYKEEVESSPYYPEFNGYQPQQFQGNQHQNNYGHQSQVQNYPSFNGQYDNYQIDFNQPQISQGYQPTPSYNNEYENSGNHMASILPHYENGQSYGNPFNGYYQHLENAQFPEQNNEINSGHEMASIFPSYGNGQGYGEPFNAYNPTEYQGNEIDNSGDQTFSILPYFGNGQNYGKPFNAYDSLENEISSEYNGQTPSLNDGYENSGDQTFSTLPYFESDHQYKNPSYVFDPESVEGGEYEYEEENESEQQNDPKKIQLLIIRNDANIDAIHEGALEEIDESEANIINKSKGALFAIEQLRLGKINNQGPRIESFKRGLFSSFIPKTSRNIIKTATKSVSSGLNLISLPLSTITTLRKEVEAQIPKLGESTQEMGKLFEKLPFNNVAQKIKQQIENPLAQQQNSKVVKVPLSSEVELKKEDTETSPEPISKIETDNVQTGLKSIFELPEPVNVNEEGGNDIETQEEYNENEQSNSPCLAEAASIKAKVEENLDNAQTCIIAADLVAAELILNARGKVNGLYENAKEEHSVKVEQLNMCAHSQFARCVEEEDDLENIKTVFATKSNDELALVTKAEENHANTVNSCLAQATGMHTYLQNIAADSAKNCEDDETY